MFRIRDQREWEDLVRRGLRGEVWALEVAAETSLSAISDPKLLGREGTIFLSHLVWLAYHCQDLVSWITRPSCEKVREEFSKLGVKPRRWTLPIDDRILLRRMFNAVPVLWAEDSP